MKTKFTPGPWFAVDYAGTFCIQDGPMYEDRDLLYYSSIFSETEPFDKETVEANAALMAAAPEMLEALKLFTENIENWLETGEPADKETSEMIYNKSKEAIKKATE